MARLSNKIRRIVITLFLNGNSVVRSLINNPMAQEFRNVQGNKLIYVTWYEKIGLIGT